MRKSMPDLILPVLLFCLCDLFTGSAGASDNAILQARQRAARRRSGATSGFSTTVSRYRPSVFDTKGYHGLSLRSDQIRLRLAYMTGNYQQGLLPPGEPIADPITASLDSRNILRARSSLGERSSLYIGRQDYVIRDGAWAGQIATPTDPMVSPATLSIADLKSRFDAPDVVETPVSTEPLDLAAPIAPPPEVEPVLLAPAASARGSGVGYNDRLEEKIRERGEGYFQKGTAYCREKNYLTAMQFLELYRQSDTNNSKALAAITIVAFQQKDLNRAVLCLSSALKEMKSLDDVRLNIGDFYPDSAEFQRAVDEVTVIAKRDGSSPRGAIMMAYYQWLNGDLAAAITAAETALSGFEAEEKVTEEKSGQVNPYDRTSYARKFRTLLLESRTGAGGSTPTPAGTTSPPPN